MGQLPPSMMSWPVPGAMMGTIMNTIMINEHDLSHCASAVDIADNGNGDDACRSRTRALYEAQRRSIPKEAR